MPTTGKSLRQRMRDKQAQDRQNAKAIQYPLPDLKGPGGNAFNLLGVANHLMKNAGVSETIRDSFRRQAMNGDYEHLLDTIKEWFTVVVPVVSYVELEEDVDIKSFIPRDDAENADPDEGDDTTSLDEAEVNEILDVYEESAERARQIAEVQDRINREVRQDLGLDDDDVVIVQIKSKKRGA